MNTIRNIRRLVAPTASTIGFAAIGASMLLAPAPLSGQVADADADATSMGRFDFGKMWTFEYAPMEYFSETYGFDANAEWFERARLSVLRIPGCSASFVSPNGLVVTNHHCVRSRVSAVSQEGEGLLDNGFFATDLVDERPIPEYFADQLISVNDVSDEVLSALDAAGEDGRAEARQAVSEQITARLLATHPMGSDSVWVQIVPLYNGGRYSAYVFRRFTDVRLVAAAELNMGFFGGDPDNFTYPRYALDFAFLRVYGQDGEPFQPTHYFDWGDGVSAGDPVFIIGNPGRTNRLQTVAQLEYQRDVQVPSLIQLLDSRHQAMVAFRAEDPETAERLDLRNSIFGLSNSLKASLGRIDALGDEMIIARKADADRQLREAITRDPQLSGTYGDLFERIARVQDGKRVLANSFGAFLAFGSGFLESSFIRRAMAARSYVEARDSGAAEDQLAQA
ncbi:MAG: S46 family peptidase, partial [Gemmatimonadota bacterium]